MPILTDEEMDNAKEIKRLRERAVNAEARWRGRRHVRLMENASLRARLDKALEALRDVLPAAGVGLLTTSAADDDPRVIAARREFLAANALLEKEADRG